MYLKKATIQTKCINKYCLHTITVKSFSLHRATKMCKMAGGEVLP
jgi:hypothetical protein